MGFVVRSWFQENAEEERANLFHVNRERKNGARGNLDSLLLCEGEGEGYREWTVEEPEQVEAAVRGFFLPLFSGFHGPNGQDTGHPFVQDRDRLQEFLQPLPEVSDASCQVLERPISFAELAAVVKDLPNNRAPGEDGLPYEFYVRAFPHIGRALLEVFVKILERKELSVSQRRGVTRLIPKVTGVPKVTQLRPITLLQCDYKILTKILVGRLLPVLPEVISSGQLCSVQGRNILHGASALMSSLLYIEEFNIPAAVVSLDQWKAYDRVFVPFLLQVMEKMAFGDNFIAWIKMLHEGNTTRFILNTLSEPVDILFSVRQGDPIAMLLYVIFLEPLLLQLQRRLRGVKIGRSIKMADVDYVDDVNVLVEDERDFVVIDDVFGTFEKMSGAILNRSHKSKVLGLGRWRNRLQWPLPWLDVQQEIKVFGFLLSSKISSMVTRNWDSILKGISNVLSSWASRRLVTLRQRVQVIQIFAASKLWYAAQVIPMPISVATKVMGMFSSFIWRGNYERLGVDELVHEEAAGGLGLVWVAAKAEALLLKHACRLLAEPDHSPYRDHLRFWLGRELGANYPDLEAGDHPRQVPRFFVPVLDLIQEAIGRWPELLHHPGLQAVKVKTIYKEFVETPPPPKIEAKIFLENGWTLTWTRLAGPVHDLEARNALFLALHDVLPTKKRLHRLHRDRHPFCPWEEDGILIPLQGPLPQGVATRRNMEIVGPGTHEDVPHLFLECGRVREVWMWLKGKISDLLPLALPCPSDRDLLFLQFPPGLWDDTICWLISSYVALVYEDVKRRGLPVRLLPLQRELARRFALASRGRRVPLVPIDFLA